MELFGQIFKELQNKYSEKPVFQKCAFVDLPLWLSCIVRTELSPYKFVFYLIFSRHKLETQFPLFHVRDLEYSPYTFNCTFR